MPANPDLPNIVATASPATIAALVEQLGRQVQNLCFTKELAPVQWAALRYLAKAGPAASTVSGLAAYSGVNVSSASRTVQALHGKQLVSVEMDSRDGRVRQVQLTEAGRHLLERDPLNVLAAAVEAALAVEERRALRDLLEKVLFELCPKPFKSLR